MIGRGEVRLYTILHCPSPIKKKNTIMPLVKTTVTQTGPSFESIAERIMAVANAVVVKNATAILENAKESFPPPTTVPRVDTSGESTEGIKDTITMKMSESPVNPEAIIGGDNPVLAYIEVGTGRRGASDTNPNKAQVEINYRDDWAGMVSQPFLNPARAKQEPIFIADLSTAIKEALKI